MLIAHNVSHLKKNTERNGALQPETTATHFSTLKIETVSPLVEELRWMVDEGAHMLPNLEHLSILGSTFRLPTAGLSSSNEEWDVSQGHRRERDNLNGQGVTMLPELILTVPCLKCLDVQQTRLENSA